MTNVLNQCDWKLINCQKEAIGSVMGKSYCKNCLDKVWATLQALESLRKEQGNKITVSDKELTERINKFYSPLVSN